MQDNPQAKEVFFRALEISTPKKRERFVDEACGDDLNLRRRVEALLSAHDEPESYLDRPAARFDVTVTQGDGERGSHLSDSSHHGRFLPGTKVANRYRIVSMLGRGGMGEVYRADDLRLGQTVALKFLPPELAKDQKRLEYFHNEVRLARQISHPNVCRVYDIGEVDGQQFISMEYIDGEDLKVLLHRIERLPKDKGIQIAQQLCSGLAAAHAKGVLHRDLKPANVMIDGQGQARITDFGLAAATVDGENIVGMSGTPAYMAPEQLLRGQTSVQSDLYSLGLTLYELFTGHPAHQVNTIEDIRRKHEESSSPSSPRTFVEELDVATERAIMWCLSSDVNDRPRSAYDVAHAFPGGDPLAAALARGEIPSPQLLAQANIGAALSPKLAFGLLASVILMLLFRVAASDSWSQLNRANPTKRPIVLADRASDLLRHLGCEPGFDSAYGLRVGGRRSTTNNNRGDGYTFWYREAQTILGAANYRVEGTSPVFCRPSERFPEWNQPGMQGLHFDSAGRLTWFRRIPGTSVDNMSTVDKLTDWSKWFIHNQVGFSLGEMTPTEHLSRPPDAFDQAQAWTGKLGSADVFVQAAAWKGKPVYFEVFPKSVLTPANDVAIRRTPWRHDFSFWFMFVAVSVSSCFAIRNLRLGIADRDAAFKGALLVASFNLLTWLLLADHQFDAHEYIYLPMGLQTSLTHAFEQWVLYVALEPFVRRYYPHVLVSWKRVLAGKFLNAQVGRDVLVGVVAALTLTLLLAIMHLCQVTGTSPLVWPFSTLDIHEAFASCSFNAYISMCVAVGLFVLAVLAARIVRHPFAGYFVLAAFFYLALQTTIAPQHRSSLAVVIPLLVVCMLVAAVCFRLGLLTMIVMILTSMTDQVFPITTNVDAFYFRTGMVGLIAIVGLAVYGCIVSQRTDTATRWA